MTIQRMDNVAIVVEDLDAAIAFFTELGMEVEARQRIEGLFADQAVGLDGIQSEIAMMRIPDAPRQAGADEVLRTRGDPRAPASAQHGRHASRHVPGRRHR